LTLATYAYLDATWEASFASSNAWTMQRNRKAQHRQFTMHFVVKQELLENAWV